MNQRIYIGETCHIAPKCITVVSNYEWTTPKARQPKMESLFNLKKKRTTNALSRKSRQKLMNAINWLVYSTPWKTVYSAKYKKRYKWKINLLTVTLPVQYKEVTVKEFQEQLLQPFLANLRKNYNLGNYIWKIEPTKKGTLHAHITTDTWLHKDDLRRIWNKRLQKNGYTARYFQEKGNHSPPSTEVHSVKQIRNLGAYLAKYLAKSAAQSALLVGRLWGCNYELSRVQDTRAYLEPSEAQTYLAPLLASTMERKEIYSKPDNQGRTMYFATCFFPKARDWINQALGPLKDAFDDSVFYLRSHMEAIPLLAYST